MFKNPFTQLKISKAANENLRDTISRLREELSTYKKKPILSPIDLTRECLKILPLDMEYEVMEESKVYLENLAELADNDVFNKEIKKIIYEQTQFIAEQSPTEQTTLLSRGTINGAILLLERAKTARDYLEYNKKGVAELDA